MRVPNWARINAYMGTHTKTVDYLSGVADANGESLADLIRATGIRPEDPEGIRIGAVIKLRDYYGANPVDMYEAVQADIEAGA